MNALPPRRARPDLHFTAAHGWTNDPHGIVLVDGAYHMFFQYNPAGTVWSEHCHWGHAVSDDLVHWRELDVALAPEAGEVGCWSGSVAVTDEGPVILYTRVATEQWGAGQVVLARPRHGMQDWVRDQGPPVIDGPPAGLDVVAFRDPSVRRTPDGWAAVLGAGLVGEGGCALQYSSPDLLTWTFDGVVASRRNDDREPVWTGKVWECPQLFELDGRWVLVVSVWEDDVLHHVAYGVGDLDGSTFTARTWGRFSHGSQLYATTVFHDSDGAACAMSWLREGPPGAPAGSAFASAMSLVHRLRLVDDRLVVEQHPSLDAVLGVGITPPRDGTAVDVPPGPWRLSVGLDTGRVVVSGTDGAYEVRTEPDRTVVTCAGVAALEVPLPVDRGPHDRLDLVVDADVLELTISGVEGVGACRVPALTDATVRLRPVSGGR